MPQLDQVTFLSQFFWMTLIFLGFYLVLLKQYLPRITRILKFRKKNDKGSQGSVSPTNLTDEQEGVGKGYSSLFSRALTLSRDELSNGVKGSQDWLEKEGQKGNQTHFKKTNTAYIRFLGVTSLSQNLEFKLISGLFPSLLLSFFIIPPLKQKGKEMKGIHSSVREKDITNTIKGSSNQKKKIPSGSLKSRSISITSDKKEVEKKTPSTPTTSPKRGKKKS